MGAGSTGYDADSTKYAVPERKERMSSARGDRKPCTRAGCSGTMQFGREPLRRTSAIMPADGERGWVCSTAPGHFQRESERRDLLARDAAADSGEGDGRLHG